MKVAGLIVINFCVLAFGSQSTNILNVPEDVMSFIMGCDGRFAVDGPKIPVTRTEIDSASGTETKEISMMNIAELRQSLIDTVESDDVVSQILAQVEESLEGRQIVDERNPHCTNIKIDVPPQEVKGLSEQLQAVVQQNNYQLLEQVNTLFSFKLNSFYKEIEEMLEKKLAELGAGLIQFHQTQQAMIQESATPMPPDADTSSSIGETRIFSSNSPNIPLQNFPASRDEHIVENPIPVNEDYEVVEEIAEETPASAPDSTLRLRSELTFNSESDQALDYPEVNEVPMEKEDDTVPLVEEEHVEAETEEEQHQPSSSSTAQPSTTQSPSPPSSTTTPQTTTTEPPIPETPELPLVSARSPLRRRKPGNIGSLRRSGIRRPIPSLEQEIAPEKREIVEEEAKAEDHPNEGSPSTSTRIKAMRERRKEMLDRLRG